MNEELARIIERLKSDDPQVRKDAAVALGEMENPEAIPALMDMVSDPNPAVRYFIKRSLGRLRSIHTPRHEEVVKDLKDSEEPDINLEALEKYLNHSDYTKRLTAIKGAMKIASPMAVPLFIDRLNIEEHDFVKSALVKAVGTLGGEEVVGSIVPFLKDSDSRVRANAIEGLEATGTDILGYITGCLGDSDGRVRSNALKVLAGYDREEAVKLLEEMFRTGDFSARFSSVHALGTLGPHPRVISILKEAMQQPEEELKEMARVALEKVRDAGGDLSAAQTTGPSSDEVPVLEGLSDGQLIEVDRSEIIVATAKMNWVRIILPIIGIAVIVTLIIMFPYLKKVYMYQRAQVDMSAGRFEEAKNRFDAVPDFRNSRKLAQEAKRQAYLVKVREQLEKSNLRGARDICIEALTSFPGDEDILEQLEEAYKRLALGAIEEERYDVALDLVNEYKKQFPSSVEDIEQDIKERFRARTSILNPKRDSSRMLQIMGEQGRFFPGDLDLKKDMGEVRLEQAKGLLEKNKYDKAFLLLKELQKVFPGRSDIKELLRKCEIGRATTSADTGLNKFRMRELSEMVKKYPDSKEIRKELLQLYLESGKNLDKEGNEEVARNYYRKALALAPGDRRVISAINSQHLKNAEHLLSLMRFREAESELSAVRTVKDDLEKADSLRRDISVAEVQAILKRNNLEMASRRLETLGRRYPGDSEIEGMLKQVRIDTVKDLFYQGLYEEAIGRFEELRTKYPDVSFDQEVIRARLEMAGEHFRNSRYHQAYELYKQILSNHPGNALALRGLKQSHFKAGQLYLKNRDYAKAVTEFQTALKLDSGYTAARAGLTEAYIILAKGYLDEGRLTEARRYVEESLRVFPNNEEAASLEQAIRVKEMERQYSSVGNPYIRRPDPEQTAGTTSTGTGTKSGTTAALPTTRGGWSTVFTTRDPSGDDRGDGSYNYPLHPAFEEGAFDITRFEVRVSSDQVAFRVRLAKKILREYHPSPNDITTREPIPVLEVGDGGWIYQMFDIYIDMDSVEGSGKMNTLPGRNLLFAPGDAWEKVVLVSPESRSSMDHAITNKSEIPLLSELRSSIILPTVVFVERDTFEVRVPVETIGRPAAGWKYQVLMMGYTKNDLRSSLRTIEVQAHADREHFGGGSDYHGNPNIIDLLDPTGGKGQFSMLADYVSKPNYQQNRYATIRMVQRQE